MRIQSLHWAPQLVFAECQLLSLPSFRGLVLTSHVRSLFLGSRVFQFWVCSPFLVETLPASGEWVSVSQIFLRSCVTQRHLHSDLTVCPGTGQSLLALLLLALLLLLLTSAAPVLIGLVYANDQLVLVESTVAVCGQQSGWEQTTLTPSTFTLRPRDTFFKMSSLAPGLNCALHWRLSIS